MNVIVLFLSKSNQLGEPPVVIYNWFQCLLSLFSCIYFIFSLLQRTLSTGSYTYSKVDELGMKLTHKEIKLDEIIEEIQKPLLETDECTGSGDIEKYSGLQRDIKDDKKFDSVLYNPQQFVEDQKSNLVVSYFKTYLLPSNICNSLSVFLCRFYSVNIRRRVLLLNLRVLLLFRDVRLLC